MPCPIIRPVSSPQSFVVRRTAAIGDVISSTVVADRLISMGFDVHFQAHPSTHCVLRRHGRLASIDAPGGSAHVNLDGAYEKDTGRRKKHFHQMWIERTNEQMARYGVNVGGWSNCRPRLRVCENDRIATTASLANYPRPWVFICPGSESYNVRQVPDGIWQSAAAKITGTKFWMARRPAPPNFVDLKAQHFDNVIKWVSVADLLVTCDTGPMHVAGALGVPVVAINQSSSPDLHLSDQVDFEMVSPEGLTCLNCQENVCRINQWTPPCQNVEPELIAEAANRKLKYLLENGVSAVIACYQPELETLNRCLECVLAQVDEVIITCEARSILPNGILNSKKIRIVRTMQSGIGYGRNCNFGARHSSHRTLLLMNDDVFLNPGAVVAMKQCLAPGVGLVTNLLRYGDGTIYHCGKRRGPGEKGWGHIDHKHRDCTLPGPVEMENVCMACGLMPRKVYYDLNGWDEDYFIYAEDDDFCLRLRRAGYKIISTPNSSGIHLEHQSTRKLGDIMGAVNTANAIFTRKWGRYLEHNAHKIPGDFDY